MNRLFILIGGSVGVGFLLLAPKVIGTYWVGVLTLILIWSIVAMSLDIVLGYTGLPSLGHGAFFGVGAYTVALLNVRAGIEAFWVTLTAGLAMAVILGAIYGFLAFRAKGMSFLLLTLALAQLLWALAWRWRMFTGGDDGLPGIARPDLVLIPWSLLPTANFYYFTLVWFALATGVMYLIVHSPFGRTLVGIRESETRMEALGYNVWLHKYIAFILGAFFAGLAGILLLYNNGMVHPSFLYVITSAKILLMVILGGKGTLFGPILGAAFIVLVENLIGAYTDRWVLVLGLIYIAVVMLSRQGLVGLVTQWLVKQRRMV